MPRSPSGSVWLLVAIASVLASLVGLVATGDRRTSKPRPPAPVEPRVPGRRSVELIAPVAPPPEAPPPARPQKAKPPPGSPRDARLRLTGVVVLPEGAPAAGARVVLGQQHATCGPDGRFELAFSSLASGTDLIAHLPGHEPALHAAFGAGLGKSGEHAVRLVLGPETLTLSGTVTGNLERTLKGWTVELDGPDVLRDFGLREEIRTGADGCFVLTDVPAGVHVVRAFKDRRELAFRSAPTSAGETGIKIVVYE